MRPIEKWEIDDFDHPEINEEFNPYRNSKHHLEANIGPFCSYCERPASDEGIHVEHVQPKAKGLYPQLKYKWTNFLLSCQRCNGKDNKGDKDVIIGNIHLPHTHNTHKSINYLEGGLPVVNPDLKGSDYKKAADLIDLVGLDKREGMLNHLPDDNRAKRRRAVWELAENYLNRYKKEKFAADIIADLAYGRGFWSVWITVFQDETEVKQELTKKFEGTYQEYETKDVNKN